MKEVVEKIEERTVKLVEKTFYVGECPICGEEQKNEDKEHVDVMCYGCENHESMMYQRNKLFDILKDAKLVDILQGSSSIYGLAYRRPDDSLFYVYLDENEFLDENPLNPEIDEVVIKKRQLRDAYWNAHPKEEEYIEKYYRERGFI